jgi:hypothetical protein
MQVLLQIQANFALSLIFKKGLEQDVSRCYALWPERPDSDANSVQALT